jgi:hypothetical protein
MKKYIYSRKPFKFRRVEEAEPTCGDYCDSCGDCLACHADVCWSGGEPSEDHLWMCYEDELEQVE